MLDKWAGYTWSWSGQFYPVVLWVLTQEWLFSCKNPQYPMNFMPMEKFWNVALETGILCTQTKEKSPKCSSPCCQNNVKVLALGGGSDLWPPLFFSLSSSWKYEFALQLFPIFSSKCWLEPIFLSSGKLIGYHRIILNIEIIENKCQIVSICAGCQLTIWRLKVSQAIVSVSFLLQRGTHQLMVQW